MITLVFQNVKRFWELFRLQNTNLLLKGARYLSFCQRFHRSSLVSDIDYFTAVLVKLDFVH